MRWTMSSDKLFHSANQQKPSLRTRWNKVQKLRQVLQCSWQCLSASAQNQYLKNNKQNINELMEVDGHIILHPYNFIKSNPAGSLLTGSVASATFLWSAARYGSCEFDTGEHSLGNLHIQWVQSLDFQHLASRHKIITTCRVVKTSNWASWDLMPESTLVGVYL